MAATTPMSREAESWFLEESVVAGESVVTEISIVESQDSMFDFGIEVSERAVEKTSKEEPSEDTLKHDEVKDEARDEASLPSDAIREGATQERDGLSSLSESTGTLSESTGTQDTGLEEDGSISIEAHVQNGKEKGSSSGNTEGSNNQDEASISSGERERATDDTQEAVFKSRYMAMAMATVKTREDGEDESHSTYSKSVHTDDKPAKHDDLAMTDYSDSYKTTFETNDSDSTKNTDSEEGSTVDHTTDSEGSTLEQDSSKEQDLSTRSTVSEGSTLEQDSSKDQDLSTRSTVSEALHEMFNARSSMSNSDVDDVDKYGVTTESSCDAYTISSKSNMTEASKSEANNENGVKIVDQSVEKLLQDTATEPAVQSGLASDSNITEKSVEVALAQGSLDHQAAASVDVEESNIMALSFEGRTEYSLGHIQSSGLSGILSGASEGLTEGSRSEEETLDSSIRGTQTYTFENSLESYDGNTTTSFEGNTVTSFEGNTVTSFEDTMGTGTATSFGSSLVESYSDEQDDPFKMFDITGWMSCGAPNQSSISVDGEATLGKPYHLNKSEGSHLLKEKLELIAGYVKTETPFKHLHVEDCAPARAPLSPKSTTSNNTKSPTSNNNIDDYFGKTPKHANTTTPAPKKTTVLDALSEESQSEDVGDENTPKERSMSPRSDSRVSTSEDTIQAGIRRMKLQNKVLSGARKKMETAMLQRQQKSAQESLAPSHQQLFAPGFAGISEDLTESTSVASPSVAFSPTAAISPSSARLPHNRWKKQSNNYADFARTKRSSRARRYRRMRNKTRSSKNAAS